MCILSSAELQQEINKESSKYIRHSLRASGGQAQALSPKDAAIPELVKAHYAEIDKLSDEKIALAERIVRLIARAQVRLEADLSKVMVLQGDEPAPQTITSHYSTVSSRTPITQVIDQLRSAANLPITSEAAPPPFASSSAAAPPPAKPSVGPDPDEDAEGEDEPEDTAEDMGEVEEDKEIYCFCRKLSYGEDAA
ncbi:hypothetical protein EUX98_g3862 [Antrodiella citrinella]|uniref:Inhibitor of growth protein N-terminal histone-binding domain-containing protein n=1 Tax=Antrodiella citrinella TaxID=2447956 RepID=A0A4S4MVG6_9APHY|nr:hypothetical protein EUX98_g3862 [Antrodiella citrinella]